MRPRDPTGESRQDWNISKCWQLFSQKKQGKIGKPQTMFSSNWDITSPGGRRWETEFGEIGEKIIRWWESGKPGRLGRQRGFFSSFLLQRRDAGGGRVLGQAAQLPPLPPSHQKPQQLSQSLPPGLVEFSKHLMIFRYSELLSLKNPDQIMLYSQRVIWVMYEKFYLLFWCPSISNDAFLLSSLILSPQS